MAPVFPQPATGQRPADQPWSYWDDEPVDDGPDHAVVHRLITGHHRGPSTNEERLLAAQILTGRGLNHVEAARVMRVPGQHVQYLLSRYVRSPRRLRAQAA